MMNQQYNDEFSERVAALRSAMEEEGVEAVQIALQKNVSWLTGGRSHVNTASEAACSLLLVTSRTCHLLVNNIEARRLLDEETAAPDFEQKVELQIWPWSSPQQRGSLVKELTEGMTCVRTDAELEAIFLRLRTAVRPEELKAWRTLGRLTGEAIEQAAQKLRRGQSEFAIAGLLASECWERGLEPIVNLIAVDERIFTRRHPLPTAKTLDAYAMLVVCARQNGRIASATRLVHFGEPSARLKRKHNAVVEIDARIIDATRGGRTLGELYGELEGYYREAGFAEEIAFHHQGGLTGYASRERIATPGDAYPVASSSIYAWNPSIAGVKSEDTIFVGEDGNEILTGTGLFPQMEVVVGGRVWSRPGILIR
ncbi:Xaa-Pro peptidase family protein [Paenibacillus sp. J2TS4]|uniref:M24 family metallopeptidase n=1 Tax=Paenibacillus sp. J2TS4 TaxID=2807194 RepID=UPI001B1A33E3|nr:M24 family metallopeptidase [Paenibacillus sp. J2TS4]GIP31552.1 peptidase M24 [Paenibacillus sp. J2TS4]